MADQVNVNAGGGSGAGTVVAVLLVVLVVVVLVWALAFGGWASLTGAPTSAAPATGGTTVNVEPKVNVQAPSNTGGTGTGAAPAKP